MPRAHPEKKEPVGKSDWLHRLPFRSFGGLAQRFDATGTKASLDKTAVLQHGNTLNVGHELSPGTHVRMTDIMPEFGTFTATFASSHGLCPQAMHHKGSTLTRSSNEFNTNGS
jgi:hypothetical protein